METVSSQLKELVRNMGLELQYVDIKRSGVYSSREKIIFLSNNLIAQNSDFVLSHELGHCIEKHEELAAYYHATPTSRSKLEFEANRIGIEILLFLWFNKCDFEKEDLNAVKFMEAYNIPAYLESTVRKVMSSYK